MIKCIGYKKVQLKGANAMKSKSSREASEIEFAKVRAVLFGKLEEKSESDEKTAERHYNTYSQDWQNRINKLLDKVD